MKVERLFLQNVRSIKSLDLDFGDPVTSKPMSRIVLAGANGSGKTTMLVRMASKQVPDDIRVLVEERILPRWRRARSSI